MPAAVQTRSRQNRIRNMKQFQWHATPHFRCYHGSRLPPKSFEHMWPSSKFYSKDIKWGRPKKGPKKKVSGLLKQKAKALPAKRKKRGILKRVSGGRQKAVIKRIKPKKAVRWSKVKGIGKRIQQKEQLYDPDVRYTGGPRPFSKEQMVGSRGDPRGTAFRLTAAGKLVPVRQGRRTIQIL